MGWAEVGDRGAFYFAHAYAAETEHATEWSEGVVAEARLGSFVGCQFHPEKSGALGARYLEEALCLSRV
jgi:glutamine amidotransferase